MALLSFSRQLSVLEPSGRIAQWPRTMALLSSSQQLSVLEPGGLWREINELLLRRRLSRARTNYVANEGGGYVNVLDYRNYKYDDGSSFLCFCRNACEHLRDHDCSLSFEDINIGLNNIWPDSSFWPSKGQLLLHSITTSKASLILCRGPRTCDPTNSFKTCAIPKPISGFRRTCPAQLSWVRREAFTHVLGSENPSLTNKKRNHGDFRVRAFSEEQTAFVVKPWNAMKKDAGELDLKFLLRVLVLIVSKPLKWE
ncbi:hypothetical protein MRB53_028008 [Persea americana]|uniref:Uncharacterized protein n=1 Tax=Persea americana TaxID=3435 RepID=A0ACC2KEC6_PERAE|nr:hypothetical protein MRB53_028008 [Persea americana]